VESDTGLSHLCGAAQSHNTNRIPRRVVNPASTQILGRCNPQAAAPRPTIKASTTGTRGLFTPVLVLTASSWEACSAADGFSDMSFFILSFREIIPKSNYIPQTNKAIPPELEGYLLCYHGGIGGEMLCRPSRAKNFLDKYAVFIE
jgi:hypothetical protein